MKRTVMLLLPDFFPVPDVKGGGVELLITQLMNENEKRGDMKLVIVSKYDKEAAAIRYHNSSIYYFEKGNIVNRTIADLEECREKYLSGIEPTDTAPEPIDSFVLQCLCIAEQERAEKLIIENMFITDRFKPLIDYFGKENVFNHLHCHRRDSGHESELVPNTLSISRFVRDEWLRYSCSAGRNEVLYNCVDTEKYAGSLSDSDRQHMRESLGFCEDDIIVTFCGRLIPVKGVGQLLDAFELIDEKNIKLMLIGSFRYASKEWDRFSQKTVARALKMKNVTYMGYIPNAEMPDYYAISDILTVPSVWQEGAGLVALEGMASGLPLIITDSGGMVEYVNDDCAVKVPIDGSLPQNLANSILALAHNKALRKKMSSAGKLRAALFDKKNYYQNFSDIVCAD